MRISVIAPTVEQDTRFFGKTTFNGKTFERFSLPFEGCVGVRYRSRFLTEVCTDDCEEAMKTDELDFAERLSRIERLLQSLVDQRTIKEWYSTAEVAQLLGKAEFTVREWCRLGRVRAEKKKCGRGVSSEWIISHEELTRVRNEGLLPEANPYRHVK